MKKMVMMLDYTELPRAWGAAENVDDARRAARANLDAYCAKQKAIGEINLADPTKYTERVEDLREIEIGALVQITNGRSGFRFGVVVAPRAGGNGKWLVCKWMDNSQRWTLPQAIAEDELEPVIPERLNAGRHRVVQRARASMKDGRVTHPSGVCLIPVLP